ncbi:MAG: type II secretion system F family protein [Stellaceae bacterium]
MALYRYKAVNGAGEIVEGTMDAPTQLAAVRQLNGSGLTPIRADEARPGFWSRPIRFEWRARRSPGLTRLAMFTRELAMLIDAGLPLDRALQATADMERRESGWRIDAVIERVRSGAALHRALAEADGFPGFYAAMVEAGEASGNLVPVLQRLADYLEGMARLGDSLRSAMIYPALVAVTCLGSLAVFIGFVLPQFEGILRDAGAQIPTSLAAMMAVARFLGAWWWLLLALGLFGFVFARRKLREPEARRAADALLLRVPLIGPLVRKAMAARFARTLGLLLQNGVTLALALAIARGTVTNAALREGLDLVLASVREGRGFSGPLIRARLLPDLAAQLIKVGEETARLAEVMTKVADIYDWELRRALDRLIAVLVPGLTIAMGVIVAFVVGSILTAMFSIYNVAL